MSGLDRVIARRLLTCVIDGRQQEVQVNLGEPYDSNGAVIVALWESYEREGGKSGMIYVKSILAGIACVCVASFLMLEAIGAYLSVVYHVGAGPIGWNSSFLASPLNWLFTLAMFLVGFFWEFRRARSK